MCKKLFVVLLITLFLATACANKMIYMKPGQIIQLRETIKNAKVWIIDDTGQKIPARANLENGWYVGPLD